MLCIGVASRQAKPSPSGFTIFELIIVLVILAILGTVALPDMRSGMRREQLAATSLDIVNWLERTRNQAVKDMELCKLSITTGDANDASIAITSDSPGCRELTSFSISNNDNLSSDTSLALSDNSDDEFSFSPRGSVNRDQEMELTMEGNPTTRCIKVVAPVGLIRSGIKRNRECRYEQELRS